MGEFDKEDSLCVLDLQMHLVALVSTSALSAVRPSRLWVASF